MNDIKALLERVKQQASPDGLYRGGHEECLRVENARLQPLIQTQSEIIEGLVEALQFYQSTSYIPMEATIRAYNTGDTVLRDYLEYCRRAREAITQATDKLKGLVGE